MRFGRLIVKKQGEPYISPSGRKRIRWYCDCDCGRKDILVFGDNLNSNHTQSCGCLKKERQIESSKKYNMFDLSGSFGIGYTFNGESFYFDLEDYDKIKDYCWFKTKQGYVATDYNNKRIYMHRLVMLNDINENVDIDHIGHILYDNRKEHLRIGDSSHNMRNSSMHKNNTSGITGVWWFSDRSQWVAEIRLYNQKKILGYFTNLNDAIKARKDAEEKYFGEWSYDNSMKIYNTSSAIESEIEETEELITNETN